MPARRAPANLIYILTYDQIFENCDVSHLANGAKEAGRLEPPPLIPKTSKQIG